MVENARNKLDSAKNGLKYHWVGQKTNLTELTQERNILSLIKNILSQPREYSISVNGIFLFYQENILSLPKEYSVFVNGIFLFCQENILSLLGDMADDVAMWTPVDDVDDDSTPTCRMTWLSSQARILALSGFSGRFPAKLWRALQGSFQLQFRWSLYRRTRIDERNLRK